MLTILPGADYSPTVSVSEVSPLSGTRGWDASNQSCQSLASVHLTNDAGLGYGNVWWVGGGRLSDALSEYNGSMVSGGFRVTIVESSRLFSRILQVPIQDCDFINASVEVQALCGSANVSLGLSLYYGRNDTYATSEISAGETKGFVVSLPLDSIKALDPKYWFRTIYFGMWISAQEQVEAVVHALDVEAHSSKALSPVSVDLQTTDGYSLLTNPRFLPDYLPLLINIHRHDDERQDAVFVQMVNETFYLPAGNYSIEAGWSGDPYHLDYVDYESADIVIRENQTTLVRIRLPTVRLTIDLSPNLTEGRLTIYTSPYHWDLYRESIGPEMSESVFLPASVTYIGIEVYHSTSWGHRGSAFHCYEPDGSSDLLVTIGYSYIVLPGIALTGLDIVTILLIVVLIVALILRFRHALFPKRTESVLSDPGLIPLLLTLAAAFLPWFRYNERTMGLMYEADSFGVVLPQFAVITEQTPFGMTAFYMLEPWFVVLPMYVLLFWAPLFGILSRLGTKEPALSWNRVISIACPALLALVSWLVAAGIGWVPDAGMWMILLSPVVFFIHIGIRGALVPSRAVSTKT